MNPFRKQPATEAEPAPPVFDSDQEHQNRLARLRRELESFRALHAGSCLKFGQYEERSIVLGDIRAALQEIDRAPANHEKLRAYQRALDRIRDYLGWSRDIGPENVEELTQETLRVMRGPHADLTDTWRERAKIAEKQVRLLEHKLSQETYTTDAAVTALLDAASDSRPTHED